MNFTNNPYYSPELCNLEIFDSVDTAGSYEFDIFAIWKKVDDNTLWYASDSGCSCPTPFENIDCLNDLTPITKETLYNFNEAIKNHNNISQSEMIEMITKVQAYFK